MKSGGGRVEVLQTSHFLQQVKGSNSCLVGGEESSRLREVWISRQVSVEESGFGRRLGRCKRNGRGISASLSLSLCRARVASATSRC